MSFNMRVMLEYYNLLCR